MKRIIIAIFVICSMGLSGCSTLQSLSNILSEADAASAIKEALIIGSNFGANSLGQKGSFSKDVLLSAILPQEAQKVVQTLERLGLASELNRFTNTLDNAAIDAASKSAPIFIDGISHMSIRDAIGIVKKGGTAATDYLRRTVGDTLRGAVKPIMRNALNEYKIAEEWDKLIGPAKLLLGNKLGLNLNIENILSVMLTNEMFKKIEQQEVLIRTTAKERTSSTLQRVFGKDWNTVSTR